jgi:UvrB/uvrC motif
MAVATRTILRKSRWFGEISGLSTQAPYAPGAQNQPPTRHAHVDLACLRVHSDFVNFDISHLLESWEYQPGQVVVRKFVGKDGVEKIQLRVDLGLLQMNAHGRPDGKRPFGHPSLFDYQQARLKQHQEKHEGSSDGFKLKPEDCAKLQLEALQYHHRYICLLQLEDYGGVVRDTERNLRLFEFVCDHAESEELGWSLQQFRPQVLMLRARARATQKLMAEDYTTAIEEIEDAVGALREFYTELSRPELCEQSPEIQSLEHWLEEIKHKRPLSKREQLEIDLSEAVKREDYEKAAKVRDALRKLESPS